MSAKTIIKGTIIFTVGGIICRILGFIFRIYISRIMPAAQIGLYQMVMPVCILGQAVAVGGLSTAVSKYAAAYRAQNKKDVGYLNFLVTLLFCALFSTIIALIIGKNSTFIAGVFLKNDICSGFLVIAAASLPFACIHAVIASYFVGLELPAYSAVAQVIEQIVRMACVFVFAELCAKKNIAVDGSVAMYGILAGEIGSSLFTFLSVIFLNNKYKTEETGLIRTRAYYVGEAVIQLTTNLKLALPITANRVILHLMQSFEAVLLPMMLMVYGMSDNEALSSYGVLMGMTMPLVLFPATVTNSMSQALLPDISKSWQLGNLSRLNKSMSMALIIAANIGIMCIPGFYFYGSRFGMIIFNNPDVLGQVQFMSLICPFIFMSTPLSSSLNAMGKSGTVFFSSLLSQLIRLALVVFIIPRVGLIGYCIGSVISYAFVCVWQMAYMQKITGCAYRVQSLVVSPVIRSVICFFATFVVYALLHTKTSLPEAVCLVIGGALYVGACVVAMSMYGEKKASISGHAK